MKPICHHRCSFLRWLGCNIVGARRTRRASSLRSGRMLLTGWNVIRAILLPLLLLNQFNESLHDSLLIRIILFCLRPKPIPGCFLRKLCAIFCSRRTALGHFNPALSSICAQLTHICPAENGCTAESLARVLGEEASLLSSGTSTTSGFVDGHSGSTQTLALGEEAFASVSLDHQFFMLVAKLVPQCMELAIVWPMYNMTQPGIDQLLDAPTCIVNGLTRATSCPRPARGEGTAADQKRTVVSGKSSDQS